MRITQITSAVVEGYKLWNFVRVETDTGLHGIGEAHPGEGVAALVEGRLESLLLGRDPRDVEPLYHEMLARTYDASAGGTMLGAIAGVETALWDVAGKAQGLPVFRLLGGGYRDRIRLYADVGRDPHTGSLGAACRGGGGRRISSDQVRSRSLS